MAINCKSCNSNLEPEMFPKPSKKKNGELSYGECKKCQKLKNRQRRLKAKFNINQEEYNLILSLQSGCCAICKQPPKEGKSLAVDHDHKTGLIRGLLCYLCNRAIGVFKDNLYRLEQSVLYLRIPPATQALGEERYGLKGRVTNKAATVRRLNKELFEQRAREKETK
jgi:hypothetical protein